MFFFEVTQYYLNTMVSGLCALCLPEFEFSQQIGYRIAMNYELE